MSLDRVHRIVAAANALAPDLHVVLGDLPAHYRLVTRAVPMAEVAAVLAGLRAPLGRFAVLGNHDWWDDPDARFGHTKAPMIHRLLDEAGIPVLANGAQRLPHGAGVWLAGTDSMLAFGSRSRGADRLPAALAPLAADDSPAILLAHEPAMFDQVPPRVALTLSGHTHGGQVRLLGHSFVSPRFAGRHVYGHVAEGARQLVVSGGLGCSIVPVRLGVPPELTLVQVS